MFRTHVQFLSDPFAKSLIVYQKPADVPDPAALVQDLQSSNPENPAFFIGRPVESQGPVYTDVDGSSDNTFDTLPDPVAGADWIATRRLSDPKLKTDLEFRINPSAKGATVFVSLDRLLSDRYVEAA